MKLVLYIFLSLQIVTNFTFFEDVVRIPVLIRHYQEHNKNDGDDITFIDLLPCIILTKVHTLMPTTIHCLLTTPVMLVMYILHLPLHFLNQ